jgi:hypothetical protein
MCVVAGGIGAAVAGGVASAGASALLSGGGGGGGGGGGASGGSSLGQGIGDILAGGLSAGLGIQGLAGGNLNQLQAGAAASNPFGQYATGFVPTLQNLLNPGQLGSIQGQTATAQQGELSLLNSIMGSANISTNTGGLSAQGNISTPGQTSALQGLLNNPTQLLSTLQGGGVQLPSGISAILGQNPYSLTSGEQFQETQGLSNLNRSLAQTGQLGSGNQYAAAEQYGQNFASQAVQQNITNLLGAQTSANQTSTTNQGLQGLVNQMGQNQFGNTASLASLLTGQQQQSFSNQLGTQQLQSTQQQNSQVNLQNLLQSMMGINSGAINANLSILGPLLTATQASNSSPASAGGILANLGVANQASGSNIASGLAGLGSGVGQLLSGLSFGSGGSTSGSENFGASSTSTPDDLISGYTG